MTYALLVLCAVLFVWKLADLVRDPRNAGAWTVTAACGCMAAVVLLAKPDVVDPVDRVIGADAAALLRNLALVGCFASLQLFYLTWIATFRTRRRVQIELLVVVAAAVVMTVATLSVPDGVTLAAQSEQLESAPVLAFFSVASGYVCYACLTQAFWTIRFFRRLQQLTLRISTLLVGAGCLMLLIPQTRRLVLYVATAASVPNPVPQGWVPALFLVRAGVALLLCGLLLPILVHDGRRVAAVVRRAVRYHRLGPLDRAITAAFPELVRPTRPGAGATAGTKLRHNPTRIGFAYHERLQRCRDGWSRAQPFVSGDTDPGCPAVRALVAALNRNSRAVGPAEQPGETDHLLAVSEALRRTGAGA